MRHYYLSYINTAAWELAQWLRFRWLHWYDYLLPAGLLIRRKYPFARIREHVDHIHACSDRLAPCVQWQPIRINGVPHLTPIAEHLPVIIYDAHTHEVILINSADEWAEWQEFVAESDSYTRWLSVNDPARSTIGNNYPF